MENLPEDVIYQEKILQEQRRRSSFSGRLKDSAKDLKDDIKDVGHIFVLTFKEGVHSLRTSVTLAASCADSISRDIVSG
uniref:Uncharacterized protein n=1 Tax=Panagrolaimus superbus TaxID=310955 RepID=A0A914YFX3_9BILA